MGFVRLDEHSGVSEAWEDAAERSLATQDFSRRSFTHLSYDPGRDTLIMSNGESWVANAVAFACSIPAVLPSVWTHVAFAAASLKPTSALRVCAAPAWLFPIAGMAAGFTADHTTGTLYAYWRDQIVAQARTNTTFNEDYGNAPFYTWTTTGAPGGVSNYAWDTNLGEQVLDATLHDITNWLAGGVVAARPIAIKGDQSDILCAPVVMDDVVAFAYGQGSWYGSYVSLVRRDAPHTWVSSRPLDLAYIFALCPVTVDQFVVVGHIATDGFTNLGQTAPLVALTFRYDRVALRLELDDATLIPTSYTYTWPEHVGFMAYDTKRQALILLSPDQTTFERYTFDQLCHPVAPTAIGTPVPLGPLHAGFATPWATMTLKGAMPVGNTQPQLLYSGSALASYFTEQPTTLTTSPTTGAGTVTVGLASAACGASLTLTFGLSSFSVGVSTTATYGAQYGIEAMSLLSVSAGFVVSSTLSAAASATTVTASVQLLAKRPVQATATAGGGAQRELDHPSSGSYPSPYIYELNPQVWVGVWDRVLQKPIFGSTRTLQKTATVQFAGDDTDVVIEEVWMGGGNRIAMPLSMWSSLWDYFNSQSALDLTSQSLLWRPRDLSNRTYKVIITDLTVGGNDGVELDHLSIQGDGYVHSEVRMRMRVIGEVS